MIYDLQSEVIMRDFAGRSRPIGYRTPSWHAAAAIAVMNVIGQ